ncbi:hypothetical protein LX95_01306 [Mesonia algae]|uniref:Uncharacterized protein n=1 Tax=Mesonia algae TaxID=213248 RepID=A0A2W7I977_9FLAO|nr:hypothetical protein [Mesonia algae]PZW41625.1 hypothetical protein LX95_01306 [Mesonia algae]
MPENTHNLSKPVKIVNPSASVDGLHGPYLSLPEAFTAVPISLREKGRYVLIENAQGIIEQWTWKKGILDTDIELDSVDIKTQVIDSGGNYNNVELTGNVLVFTNTNAQAILNGFNHDKYKRITVINNGDFEIRINKLDGNSDADKQIKLPNLIASTGIEGSCELIYVDVIQKWQLIDQFASKYRPEHRGLPNTQVEVVTPDARSETVPIIELEVFRDAQSTGMSKSDLNTAYPTALRGFMVICKQINLIYKKVDANTNDWVEYKLTPVA